MHPLTSSLSPCHNDFQKFAEEVAREYPNLKDAITLAKKYKNLNASKFSILKEKISKSF